MKRRLSEQQAALTEVVIDGAADWGAYMYHIGRIRGIQFAMQTLADVIAEISKADRP